jgi:hypothetical protein
LTTVSAFIRRHPGATRYVLAFPLSWGCVFPAAGEPDSIPGTSNQVGRLFLFVRMRVAGKGPARRRTRTPRWVAQEARAERAKRRCGHVDHNQA